MKFIRKPVNKFEKGYCFACTDNCSLLCTWFTGCNNNSGCVIN
ncbi:MAG: Clo7bot family Cys-rich peptide [Paraclostridium bifermentans]|nr:MULTISPECIES: Clo7bot family Cys-rich peptide [Paraclostridium]MBS5953797.1 Clo7bot family Cys-rich peptide [Paraclostridium bifermentans]